MRRAGALGRGLRLPGAGWGRPAPVRGAAAAAAGPAGAGPGAGGRAKAKGGGGPAAGGGGAQRLGKALAVAGVASRRKAEELVFGGTVTVNGRTVTKPQTLVTLGRDRIAVDGREVGRVAQKKYYFIVNKPKGLICSREPTRSVYDLLDPWLTRWRKRNPADDAVPPRFFSVGRLDVNTTGVSTCSAAPGGGARTD